MAIFKRKTLAPSEGQGTPSEVKSVTESDLVEALLGASASAGLVSTYPSQLRDGFRANPYIARCVDLRANAVASLDPVLLDADGNVIEDRNHPLARLLRRPSLRTTWRDMVYQAEAHLALNGNAYLWTIRTIMGVELIHIIPPDRVTAMPSNDVLDPVAYYSVNLGSQIVKVEPRDMIHLHTLLDSDGITGISPLDAASLSVDAQTEARVWNASLMRNGAKPSVTVTTQEQMTPATFQRFKERMQMMFSGGRNAGKILVLDGGKTASYDGFNARDMDYSAGLTLTAREICLALGVPPELAGDSANKTYSNAQEAHKEFAINTIEPLAVQLFDALTRSLCRPGDDVASIGYDSAQIEGMKQDESALISALTSCDFLSDNEKRARLSYDAIPDGDVILTGMGKVPRSEIVSDPLELLNDNRADEI